jgi:hypothetical protein
MASGRLLPRLVCERWPAVRPSWSAAEVRLSRFGADAGLYGAARLVLRSREWHKAARIRTL